MAFQNNQRFFGSQADIQQKNNLSQTFYNFTKIIGSQSENEKKFLFCNKDF